MHDKVTLPMAMLSPSECVAVLGGLDWLVLFLAGVFWVFRLMRFLLQFVQFLDIKQFFNMALKIEDVSDSLKFVELPDS